MSQASDFSFGFSYTLNDPSLFQEPLLCGHQVFQIDLASTQHGCFQEGHNIPNEHASFLIA